MELERSAGSQEFAKIRIGDGGQEKKGVKEDGQKFCMSNGVGDSHILRWGQLGRKIESPAFGPLSRASPHLGRLVSLKSRGNIGLELGIGSVISM